MIPQPFDLAIPAAASAFAAWLRDDRLPPWLNYAIIAFFFVVACLASIFAAGLSGDPNKDMYVIVGVCAAVFAALETAMNKVSSVVPSPLGALAVSSAKHAVYQKEFDAWVAAQTKVPPRASAQPQPPPGGSVIAPPSGPTATRVDLPAIPPKDLQPPTNQ